MQLLVFAPEGDAGSRDWAAFLDEMGHLAHLRARGAEFAVVSRAPYTRILPFGARMGSPVPWYSSYGNTFNHHFDVVERSGVGLEGLGSTAGLPALTASGAVGGDRNRHHDKYEE